jgi:oxaloacetate decarboxylase alpha subunit
MDEIYFVDTTFRDAHQSLWAEAMTTSMMLSMASQIDRIGFKAMDFISLSMFKKAVVELHEDPWERIELLGKTITRTPRSMMVFYSILTFSRSPMCLTKLFIERAAAHGIKRAQMMHASNDLNFKLPETTKFARDAGLEVVLALSYSVSPKHTDEYYAQKTRDAVKLKPNVIYLKDQGGLLTPDRIKTLIPVIQQNASRIPLELHSHCTTGLAPLCYLEAIKLGIRTVHTAIPPVANSSSQPSVMNIVNNVRHLGYATTIDEEAIKPVSDQLRYIAKREGLQIGVPVEYDVYQYMHQIPGGVISNLRHQLSKLGMGHRIGEVIQEAIEVRKDMGYPIMVTPYSQLVVSQATLNVMLGERYKQIIDEIIQTALGYWGEEAKSSITPNLRDRIMASPRAKEISPEVSEPSLEELRQKLGMPGISDDELLLRYMQIEDGAIKAMRAPGLVKEYPSVKTPLSTLVRELAKQKNCKYVHIDKEGFSLTLQKKG